MPISNGCNFSEPSFWANFSAAIHTVNLGLEKLRFIEFMGSHFSADVHPLLHCAGGGRGFKAKFNP